MEHVERMGRGAIPCTLLVKILAIVLVSIQEEVVSQHPSHAKHPIYQQHHHHHRRRHPFVSPSQPSPPLYLPPQHQARPEKHLSTASWQYWKAIQMPHRKRMR